MTSQTNIQLLEAVERYRKAEKELYEAKVDLSIKLKIAAGKQRVSLLADLVQINRTTIYWLINNWGTRADSNGND